MGAGKAAGERGGREGAESALLRRRLCSSRRPSAPVLAGLRRWLAPLSVWKLFSSCSRNHLRSLPSPRHKSGSRWVPTATGGLAGAPRATARRAAIAGPAPPFRGQLPQVTHRGLQRTAVPWRWSPGVVGVNRGTLRSSSAATGRKRSPAPSSQLAISARFASAAMGSAVRAQALQTRLGLELPEPLREPHFRVSRSLLHISPLGLPPRPSGAEFCSVSTEAHTHRRASWLCSGTGSGARLAQSIAWGDLQDLIASALSADTIPSHGCPRDRRVGFSRPYTRPGWHISLLKWLGGRPRKSLKLSAQSRKLSLGDSDS